MSTSNTMPLPTGVLRRGATYYYRRVVPEDLRAAYGKREEVISLRTKDPSEARKLGYLKAAEVEQGFANARAVLARQARYATAPELDDLTPDQVKIIRDVYVAHLLEEDEEERLGGFDQSDLNEALSPDQLPELPRRSWNEKLGMGEGLGRIIRAEYAQGRPRVFWPGEVEEVLSWSNVNLRVSVGSIGWRKAIRALQEAWLRARRDIDRRNEGDVVDTPKAPSVAAEACMQTSPSSGQPMLSVAVESWLREKQSTWGNKAGADHQHWLSRFLEIAGDEPLDNYSKADGRKFKEVQQRLPSNWTKKPEMRGMAIDKAAKKVNRPGFTGE